MMPETTLHTLYLTHEQLREIVRQAQAGAPQEVCGLLAGSGEQIVQVLPMPNVSPNPKREFTIDPNRLLEALSNMEAQNLIWLGVYHSHPNSSPRPSPTDIREARLNTPKLVQVIVSLRGPEPEVQAWRIEADSHVYAVELLLGKRHSTRPADFSPLQRSAIVFASLIAVLVLVTVSILLLPAPPPLPTSSP